MVSPQHRDLCGSFRESSFDSRVRFAVSNTTQWNPKRVYDCPEGYHWASTDEGFRYFTSYVIGSNIRQWHSESGAEEGEVHGGQRYTYLGEWEKSTPLENIHEADVYANQCGWSGLVWGYQSRIYFRFSDSHVTGAYKHAGKPDSYRPDIDSLPSKGFLPTDRFAGIVCVAGSDPLCKHGNCKNQASGAELWRTDGTVEGTSRLEDINPGPAGSNPSYLTSVGNIMYFAASTLTGGTELWFTQGTSFGQARMISMEGTSSGINPGADSSNPKDLTLASGFLMFGATEALHGRELWFINNNAYLQGKFVNNSEPVLIPNMIDIVPGPIGSNPRGFVSSGGSLPVFFQAYSPISGVELWKSSGSSATTVMVMDICPGAHGSNPQYLTWYSGKVFFQADDCVHGAELWMSDGIITTMLKDIRVGLPDSSPSFLTVVPSQFDPSKYYLLFVASDGFAGAGLHDVEGYGGGQIWTTDGTSGNTKRAFDRTANDFYFDRMSLNAAFPPSMGVFGGGVYVAARYGAHDLIVPSGVDPFHAANEAVTFGISQAAVIADVDTAPDENITAVLSVDKGVLVLQDATNSTKWSPRSLSIILAESDETARAMITEALTAQGHSVQAFTTPDAAYSAYVGQSLTAINSARVAAADPADLTGRIGAPPVDCIIMDLWFPAFVNGTSPWKVWDGLGAIRMIRWWEAENLLPLGISLGMSPTKVIAMSKLNVVVRDKSSAIAAGADEFMILAQTNYFTGKIAKSTIDTTGDETYFSLNAVQKHLEQNTFDDFAAVVIRYLTKTAFGVQISASSTLALTSSELASLPGVTVGDVIKIHGTISEVNHALRGVFFYAAGSTNGFVNFTINAQDQPGKCLAELLPFQQQNNPQSFFQSPAAISIQAMDFARNNSNASQYMCDHNQTNSVSVTIPLYVTPVNQPPSITLENTTFGALTDVLTAVPSILVEDVDHNTVTLKTSVGNDLLAPVSVVLSTRIGRLSLQMRDGLSFPQGSGRRDRVLSVRGPIDLMNTAMSTLLYVCETKDGCHSGLTDTVTVIVDDEGFSGKGGALTDQATITVAIL